uniref:Ig-like domain-containing protein n=1 Tax=Cyclopterus lumpus TaxID=8103 RepID=A0A8C2ZLV7_CYCLU
ISTKRGWFEGRSVPPGEVARFHARVSGTPKPEVSWFHNRQPVRPTKNVVFHFDEATSSAVLIIVDAFAEHAGEYTCRAANSAGEAACSATLTLTNEEEEGNFQSVLEGEPVEIKCKLVACPPPTILWFHNNKSIPKGRRHRISTDSRMHLHSTCLVIDCVKEKDSGSYKVMAINTEGSAETTASLLVSLREDFVESRADARFKHMVSERQSVVADQTVEATKVEVPYSETLAYQETTMYTESRESAGVAPSEEEVLLTESARPKPVRSIREKFEAVTA